MEGLELSAGERIDDELARRLREQAQGALGELLAAFQQAHRADGALLSEYLGADRQQIYDGLVAALMRLVVLLYAEARGLLPIPDDDAAPGPLAGLFAQLTAERSRAPGALHEGAPGRDGRGPGLFDPDAYPFLEGRRRGTTSTPAEAAAPPRIPDAVVRRVLARLMVLDGAPIDYATLEVERIGSVYEGLIGFDLELAEGESLALLPTHVVVDLEALLALPGAARLERLNDLAERQPGARLAAAVREARSVADLERALERRVSPRQPGRIARGSFYLQAGQLRRRAGSYYTPREITRLVVERTLAPLLQRDDRSAALPAPEHILSLRVCDPAMGSGAFLVEVCRQLAAHLEAAWRHAGATPHLAPGESALSCARRLVAERCLHGVDLDPLAVELARLSLWLVVRHKGHPLTFADPRLRCGNSLIGARMAELAAFPADAALHVGADPAQGLRAGRRRWSPRADPGDAAPAPRAHAGPAEPLARDEAALDAWMAIWFWPTHGELAALAPTAATFASYLDAAARDPSDRRAALSRELARERRFLHWELAFPEVFDAGRSPAIPGACVDDRAGVGFDAVLGNPPWVAYAGRAAQPIEPEVFNLFVRRNPAFHGYRSLHGLFVYQAATLLRPGGRLGLVIPTSVSDLGGYEPTRRAHDALCAVDPDLPSFGSGAFEGVFQPAMGLLSTRLVVPAATRVAAPARAAVGAPWSLARSDLDLVSRGLLDRLSALAPLPASLFGERGFQTCTEDAAHIRRSDAPLPPYTCPIREGTDIGELIARAPRHHLDRAALKGRFRPDEDWRAVKLLIRQTARYPIAALGDGLPFRNSILAGFGDSTWSELALLCYLNSWPVRWFHYTRHRDAREGMPQVKIAHLRALPAPPPARAGLIAELDALGRDVGPANAGLAAGARQTLDALVAEMLELTDAERAGVARWAEVNPLPRALMLTGG